VHPKTGRVHTSYALAATSTGRLASTDPNLQNIPIRRPEGRRIRLVAEPNQSPLGLAIRAVAQDEETARTMGINFTAIVLITFAIGSGLAAFAGIMNGLYYNEINFGIGLYLGVIGFSAAIIGGLGSIYGAILGGFLFAALQTIGTVMLPFASAYKDVFAFAVVIAIIDGHNAAKGATEMGAHFVLFKPLSIERTRSAKDHDPDK